MSKKLLPLAFSLAGVVLATSACAPAKPDASAASATSASAAATGSSPAAPATSGWELKRQSSAERIAAAGLAVLTAEGAAEHFHAHLDVFVDGSAIAVPADIGFSFGATGKPNGISALHTHDQSGSIHIEAPVVGDTYTLGQLLTQWGVLDGTDKSAGTAHSGVDGWVVAVNGTKQAGSIKDVVLKAHDEVVLAYGAAPDPLPTAFEFPGGL
ncbi:hypothetical protein [Pseudarthrobacter sp. N5]|uniref:hypothetical protein n=1 Tax=Pseudarthrobacter sp. N5 TaxID=3418416 RepID=UPI003CF946EA